jgi:hypothetical protein
MTALVYTGGPYAGSLEQIGLELHLKPCLGANSGTNSWGWTP